MSRTSNLNISTALRACLTNPGPTRVSASGSATLVAAAAATTAAARLARNRSSRRLAAYLRLRPGWKNDPVTGAAIKTRNEAVSENAPICRSAADAIGPSHRRDASEKGWSSQPTIHLFRPGQLRLPRYNPVHRSKMIRWERLKKVKSLCLQAGPNRPATLGMKD
jgi:hypothetical protein